MTLLLVADFLFGEVERRDDIVSVDSLLGSPMSLAVAQDATWKDCELGARNPDRSIAACSKILKRSSNAAAFHRRALAFEAKGKLDQAISDVSAGIRLDPQSAYRWQKRGELYARQGKYKQAVSDLTEAVRKDPTPRAFRFEHRAEAYKGLGDFTHAIADFDEAIRLDLVARAYRFRARANALRDAGQYDRALADSETALKLEPTNTAILVDRGRTYTRMGRSNIAKIDFDKALALDPSNAELRHRIEVEVAALPGQSPQSTAAASQKTAAPPTAPTSAPSAQTIQSGEPQKSPSSTGQDTSVPDARAYIRRGAAYAEKGDKDRAIGNLLLIRHRSKLTV